MIPPMRANSHPLAPRQVVTVSVSTTNRDRHDKLPLRDHQGRRVPARSAPDLSHRKSQAEVAAEAGFANANMIPILKAGKSKLPLDRIPSLARAWNAIPPC